MGLLEEVVVVVDKVEVVVEEVVVVVVAAAAPNVPEGLFRPQTFLVIQGKKNWTFA